MHRRQSQSEMIESGGHPPREEARPGHGHHENLKHNNNNTRTLPSPAPRDRWHRRGRWAAPSRELEESRISRKNEHRRASAPPIVSFPHYDTFVDDGGGPAQLQSEVTPAVHPRTATRRRSLQQWLSATMKGRKEEWGIAERSKDVVSAKSDGRRCDDRAAGFSDVHPDETKDSPSSSAVKGFSARRTEVTEDMRARDTPPGFPADRGAEAVDNFRDQELQQDGDALSEDLSVPENTSDWDRLDATASPPPPPPPPPPQDVAAVEQEQAIADETKKSRRHVNFLSVTTGLRVDTSGHQLQTASEGGGEGMYDNLPASPCGGVILMCSPRYRLLQKFRKDMASRGINAQMFRSGWKGLLLPLRDIRLFMTDERSNSVICWRYRRSNRCSQLDAGSIDDDLGAEDRRVIPVSSLANVGPARIIGKNTHENDSRKKSWRPLLSRRTKGSSKHDAKKAISQRHKGAASPAVERIAPILALCYWSEGKPRWISDTPKRLLLRPESFHDVQRLIDGLRLCCLHFHNNTCPQDLDDTL